MTRTERTTTAPTPSANPVPIGSDPLRQLEYENQTPNGPEAVRGILHPAELALRGMPVTCSACQARRDWLLLNHRRDVWVCCRCGNDWLEPEITRKDFDALIADPTWTRHPSTGAGRVALGFDGTFAGIYLDS